MYDENQILQVKWNNTNKEWYESKGYKYTKRYDIFDVKAKDLSPHSDKVITVICDYCGKEYTTKYCLITNGRKSLTKIVVLPVQELNLMKFLLRNATKNQILKK